MTKTAGICSRVAMLAVVLVSLSVLGHATPVCPSAPATLASIGVGSAGSGVTGACHTSYLNVLFSNISLAGSSASGTTQPGAIDPNDVEVQFQEFCCYQPGVSILLTDPMAGDWNLTGTQKFTLDLSYTNSGTEFFSFGDELGADASGGGTVLFDSSAMGDSNPIQALPTLSAGGLTLAAMFLTGWPHFPPDTVQITESIQVQANNGTANLTSAITGVDAVPEPTTSRLLCSGLLALGLILRRKRK
jgi:hypothetical protein